MSATSTSWPHGRARGWEAKHSSVPLAHSSSGTTSACCRCHSAITQNTCRCTVACGLSGVTVVRASYAARERCVADAPACRWLFLHHRYNIAFHQFQQRARIALWCVGGMAFCVQQHARELSLNVFFHHLFRSTAPVRGVPTSRETCPPTPDASVLSSTLLPHHAHFPQSAAHHLYRRHCHRRHHHQVVAVGLGCALAKLLQVLRERAVPTGTGGGLPGSTRGYYPDSGVRCTYYYGYVWVT
eukprot:COSAG02_NODE_821_length_16794_cov_42.795747_13_plen_242_part_00